MYKILMFIAGPLVKLYFKKPFVEGVENVAKDGPLIVVANHNAAIDSLILPLLFPRQIHFMGKDDYFNGKGIKGKLLKLFFVSMGVFPVNRQGGESALAALNSSVEVLKQGKVMGLFPEGTRGEDNKLYKFHTGVARIGLEANASLKQDVNILPVALFGTRKAQPLGQLMPSRIQCGLKIGEPISLENYKDTKITKELLREISDEVARSVQKMSGQEMVNEYAKRNRHNPRKTD
jgi:1-acyl-sn-glycerol-3-phosphate acyltransferase